jgi:RNA polymerase sigma factor (sigma-70 family)
LKLSNEQQQRVAAHIDTINRLAVGTVAKVVKPAVAARFGRDDLLQEARVAGMKAVAKWTPGRGASLDTFVILFMRRRLQDVLAKFARRAPISASLPEHFDAAQPAPRATPLELWRNTRRLRGGLSMTQRVALYLTAVERMPHREVARSLGVDRGCLSMMLTTAKRQILENRAAARSRCIARCVAV